MDAGAPSRSSYIANGRKNYSPFNELSDLTREARYSAAAALAPSSGAASMKPPDCRFHNAA
jgi:hypothetical protein